MSIAYLFDDCAVGVLWVVVRLRRRARATVPNRAAGRLAQRTDVISYRVVDIVPVVKSCPLIDCLIMYLIIYLITYLITAWQKTRFYAGLTGV